MAQSDVKIGVEASAGDLVARAGSAEASTPAQINTTGEFVNRLGNNLEYRSRRRSLVTWD